MMENCTILKAEENLSFHTVYLQRQSCFLRKPKIIEHEIQVCSQDKCFVDLKCLEAIVETSPVSSEYYTLEYRLIGRFQTLRATIFWGAFYLVEGLEETSTLPFGELLFILML